MPARRPFELTWVRKGRVRCPRINGCGLWGTNGHYSAMPAAQAYYEAPILAQQGWNNLRQGIRPVGCNLADWVEEMGAFEKQGIASIWSAYAMENDFISRTFGMPENALGDSDYIAREDGRRKQGFGGAGTLGNPWNPDFLFNSDAMWEGIAEAIKPFATAIGYQVTNEINLENGSYDEFARADWQRFLRELFGDDSPAADSNGDGAYFDKAYGKGYAAWNEVEQFRGDDFRNPAKALLKDIWLGKTYAGYIQREAAVIHKTQPDALVGASICVPASACVDLSTVCSKPDVSAAYLNTYGCWLGGGLLMAAIANTYGKPAIASEINYPAGGYNQVKWTALTMLPYYEGFQWFGYNPKDGTEPAQDEMASEYGGKYGFIDHGVTARFDGDGNPRHAGDVCKAVEYDPRFRIIPELARSLASSTPGLTSASSGSPPPATGRTTRRTTANRTSSARTLPRTWR